MGTTGFPRSLPYALAVCGLAVNAPSADVLVVGAAKDNTLYEDFSGGLSNGAGQHFFTGRNNSGEARRGVIAFDLTAIPPGSTVNSVTLTLNLSKGAGGATNTSLHMALSDWGEGISDALNEEGGGAPSEPGDATWIHTFFSSSFWTSAGGDYNAIPSATVSVGTLGPNNWSTAAMVTDVQAWVDSPAANFGWVVIGDESGSGTSKRFDTRENPAPGQQPMLTVDFTAPGDPGACCFDDGSCQSLSAGDCATQGGTFQGIGVDCVTANCQPVVGACCFDDGSCSNLTLADCQAQGGTFNGGGATCATVQCPVVLTPFVDALPLPAVAQPVSGTVGGVADYEITMSQFQQQLHRDLPPTTLWGYGGTYPGPTIEAGANALVRVDWKNELRDEFNNPLTEHYLDVDLCPHGADNEPKTVVHLHGTHTFAEFDGYPEDTYLPGNSDLYEYPNNQLPATLWYHDHALGITRLNVYMGLAGFYLIRDAFELGLNLPQGEFEIPLAIQDRSFNADGSLHYPSVWQAHFFGNTNLVNGKVWPYLDVKRGKYRFRILNGANSRTYRLSLSDGSTFQMIGTDGGLLPAPVPLTEITLGPAERADVIIDFESYLPGTEIFLVNDAPAPFPGTPGVGVLPDVMKFVVQSPFGDTDPVPAALRPLEVLDENDSVESRDFILDKTGDPCAGETWLINGLGWDDITEYPKLGTTEVWRFINSTGITHPMHMHLVMFQVLDRQPFMEVGGSIVPTGPPVPPTPEEAGWKDTVQSHPFEITRVIARFEDYTGLFAYHCHILEHEDHEMMRQFRVIPGPAVSAYGCGVNPSGSLVVESGSPSIGTTLVLGVNDPFGSTQSGALPFVAVSTLPDPAFPCGTLIPGWGMTVLPTPGELLISMVAPNPAAVFSGPPWTGPATPSPVSLPFPPLPFLVGLPLYAQGLLAIVLPSGLDVALTEALKLEVGP